MNLQTRFRRVYQSNVLKWTATWAASPTDAASLRGTNSYSVYNPQPNIAFAFSDLDTAGATNQSFQTATADPTKGSIDADTAPLYPQYAAHSSGNPTPDYLHQGRAGMQAEGGTLDLSLFAGPGR